MVQPVTRPRAQGYGAQLGTDWFRLAPDDDLPLRVYTRDSLAQRTDDRGSPEENVLEIGYAFSRSNLTGGEGLDWWPRVAGEVEIPTDQIRFWDSENINIRRPEAGAPYDLSLVPTFTDFWTPTDNPVDMGTSRDSLYVIEGTDVHRFDDLGDTTPDDSDDITVTLTQLAVGNDNSVAVLDSAGDVWFKGSQTNTYIKVYDSTVDGDDAVGVWWVKDRVIVATNDSASAAQGALVEFLPTMGGTPASPTAVPASYDTIDTFEGECYDVIDAGHAIVACFSDGSLRSYVPQSDTAGSAPTLTIRARTQVPTGEVAYRLGHNLGILLVFTLEDIPTSSMTTLRLYQASVLDVRFDYVVGELTLLRTWEDTVETAPAYTKRLVTTRDEILFAIGETTNTYNIWRYDLVTSGIFRHHSASQTAMEGLSIFDGVLLWCEGAEVVYQDSTQLEASGYLITPNITFGLNTPINWNSFVLEAHNLGTGGAYVEYFYSTDERAILDPNDSSWIKVLTYTDISQAGVERFADITATHLSLMLKLYPSQDGATSPNVNRFAVRGLPKHRDWLAELPLNVSDVVDAPGRMPLRVPGHGNTVHSTLVNLQGSAMTLTILEPPITLQGVVDTIMEPTTYITDRGSQGRRCMVRFLGSLVGTIEDLQPQGTQGLGIGPLGIATVGIGEVV